MSGSLFFIYSLFVSINTLWLCPSYEINQKSETHYKILIESNNSQQAKVELTFTVKDSLLYMSDIGANQFPRRWANFVHDLKAESKDGKIVKIEEMAGAQWKVYAEKGTKVHLSYAIHLDHEDYAWSGGVDGAAYARDWGVFYTGRSIFIMNGTGNRDLKVTFRVPDNWKISTPWDRVETGSESFIVDTQTSLSDSMFFAGVHEELIIKRDQFQLVFVLGGAEIIAQKEAFGKLATGVLDYYIEIMGGVPNPAPDNKFNKSMVIINSYSSTDGEVIGNNISILLEKDGDQMSELVGRFIFAHEFFHLWNGKTFSPVNNDCEWFKEGFTNYYTLKSLLHVGYLNKESYLDVLNAFFYQKYDQDDGVGRLSMTDGDLKHEHWGLIYSGGLFACISQDMIIRTATKNEKNIDDLMRTLYRKYGGTNKGYSLDEIQLLLTQMSGSDQSVFFDFYIRGHQKIPLGQYLNLGGFKANEANGKIDINVKDEADLETREITNGLFGIN